MLTEKIELLKDAFSRIKETVRKMLDLNRPGKAVKQATDINSIITDTFALMKVDLIMKKIEIELQLEKDLPEIIASPQQLAQLFMNLVNNAVEAMKGHIEGEERTSGGKLRVSTESKNDGIHITFADTGPGIAEKDLDYIFDPFNTRKQTIGMGLGLAICRSIVEYHQGTIGVENAPAGGAVVHIVLPLG